MSFYDLFCLFENLDCYYDHYAIINGRLDRPLSKAMFSEELTEV